MGTVGCMVDVTRVDTVVSILATFPLFTTTVPTDSAREENIRREAAAAIVAALENSDNPVGGNRNLPYAEVDPHYVPASLIMLEHTHQSMHMHRKDTCATPVCAVHARSNHVLRYGPQCWNAQRYIMERVCGHGVRHPDPDDVRIWTGADNGFHTCDGCCAG